MKYIVYVTINLINFKYYIGVHGVVDENKFDGYNYEIEDTKTKEKLIVKCEDILNMLK